MTNPIALAAYHRTQVATSWTHEERQDHEKTLKAMTLRAKILRKLERVT